MVEMKYLDFDLLVERSEEGYRARVLNSPSGQATAEFGPPFSELEVENFVLRLGRPQSGVRRLESSEMVAARTFGTRLFEAVFSDEVRGHLRSSLSETRRQGLGLRLRLHLNDVPELADLPWEYLYDPALERFFVLSTATPLVRYLDMPQLIRPLALKPPLRVLAMISSPTDIAELDVDREWAKLKEALSTLEQRGMVSVERTEGATLTALQQRLRRGEYHIFHFVGHGGFDEQSQDGLLAVEDEYGRGRWVSGRDMGTLLHDHRSLRLAFLNACEGARTSRSDPFAGAAQSIVQQGIPAVIAMQFPIRDQAAIEMAQEFYAALADGYPVDAALTEARKAVFAQANDTAWGTPVLYLRTPDGRVFDMASLQVVEPRAPGVSAEVDKKAAVSEPEGQLSATEPVAAKPSYGEGAQVQQGSAFQPNRRVSRGTSWIQKTPAYVRVAVVAVFLIGLGLAALLWMNRPRTVPSSAGAVKTDGVTATAFADRDVDVESPAAWIDRYPKLVLEDDFSSAASGWPEVNEDRFIFDYHPNEFYHLEGREANKFIPAFYEPQSFDSFVLETGAFVDAAHTDYDQGHFQYGLAVRHEDDQFYAFVISANTQEWQILRGALEKDSRTGSSADLEVLKAGKETTIHGASVSEEQEDRLTVIANGTEISFVINGQLVGAITTDDYETRHVGFIVEMLEDVTKVHIHYNWITVRTANRPPSTGMVKVDSGRYTVGADQAVGLFEFWIDRYEVTNTQYATFLDDTGKTPLAHWNDGQVPAGLETHPVQGISWSLAAEYCAWAGKRLPTEAEWEAAARGPYGWLYPWGSEEEGVQFEADTSTLPVGGIPTNRSYFGAFDMAGNVWEWVDEPYTVVDEGEQVIRGGTYGPRYDMTFSVPGPTDADSMIDRTGIRCAADGEQVQKTRDEALVLEDDFSSAASGWPEVNEDRFIFDYHPDEFYHLEGREANKFIPAFYEPQSFDSFVLETGAFVDAAHTDYDQGHFQYGLAVRHEDDQFYAFVISANTQEWQILRGALEKDSRTGSSADLEVLKAGKETTIHGASTSEEQEDRLTVIANGTEISFVINGQLVGAITTDDYETRHVGFIVETLEDVTKVHIHYNWITVLSLDYLSAPTLRSPAMATVLPTLTPTVPATRTSMPTSTPTVSATRTSMPTSTPTVLATSTSTPTVPATSTSMPTSTPTMSVTETPTVTPVLPTATPVPTPVGGTAPVSESDGMVFVPAGEFLMGSTDADSDVEDDEKPQRTVILDAFYISQYLVTNEQFSQFVDTVGYRTGAEQVGSGWIWTEQAWKLVEGAEWRHPQGPSSSIADKMDHPVVQVTWNDAEAYCRWAGKRLPTEAEWEKAARGTDARRYPWGNSAPDGLKLNFCDANCEIDTRDSSADDGYGDTSPVGHYGAGKSPYGAYDMAGNVWEWVADWYQDDYYRDAPARNPQGPGSGDKRVTRGGSWYNVASLARSAFRTGLAPDVRDFSIGFRCVLPVTQ